MGAVVSQHGRVEGVGAGGHGCVRVARPFLPDPGPKPVRGRMLPLRSCDFAGLRRGSPPLPRPPARAWVQTGRSAIRQCGGLRWSNSTRQSVPRGRLHPGLVIRWF